MSSSSDLAQRLRDRGLRLTSQRLAVLAAIEAHPEHPDAATIARAARRRAGSISTQALYNVLDDLMRPPAAVSMWPTRTSRRTTRKSASPP